MKSESVENEIKTLEGFNIFMLLFFYLLKE